MLKNNFQLLSTRAEMNKYDGSGRYTMKRDVMTMCFYYKKSLKLLPIVLPELVSPQIIGNQIVTLSEVQLFCINAHYITLNGNCIRGPYGSINCTHHLRPCSVIPIIHRLDGIGKNLEEL
jgi:hypothetical protein